MVTVTTGEVVAIGVIAVVAVCETTAAVAGNVAADARDSMVDVL